MSLEQRLQRLETSAQQNDCPTCSGWGFRILHDDDDEGEADQPPAVCGACGRETRVIRIVHVDSATWRERSAL